MDKLAVGTGDGALDTPAEVQSAFLIYDGIEPDAKLAGFMYMAVGTQGEPQGFAGPNDHWHFHTNTCVVFADGKIQSPLGADRSATQAQCSKFGGVLIENTGYMVHLWNVPGYENPDGMFGNLTPAITCPDGKYNTIPTKRSGTHARSAECDVHQRCSMEYMTYGAEPRHLLDVPSNHIRVSTAFPFAIRLAAGRGPPLCNSTSATEGLLRALVIATAPAFKDCWSGTTAR
jgi:hypothetical protein